ncbi:SIMPL domain-containing protein [Nocardioides sp. TF02-7]|uniref:SIMPL domain-containing protein n=1 Tax=Nocardioides sp. TF02-7 TaxID=2917724 RepID=UPI001F069434|nr:SIMPL domain-containing protein [Nocardioides sp. TF02-7]UMG91433.1 SIMPL domain-containing protein [Nocardioides sp. TF02-7]
MSTELLVRGTASAAEPPGRGTVRAAVAADGPAMQPVHDRVVRQLAVVTASVQELGAVVTRWSTGHVRTWADRPWQPDGSRPPPVHHARIEVAVELADPAALARWVDRHGATAGFEVLGVEWALTEEREQELGREVRARAVRDAVARAQEYADALGLGTVRPVAVADAGLLAPPGAAPLAEAVALRAGAADGGGLELAPADIEVTAAVDARFAAD